MSLVNLLDIDTRQGTNNQHSYSNGNTLPYTGVPFGMNFFAMQTAGDRGSWWFNPHDRVFQGIRLTHQPSPWMGDFQWMLFNPFSGKLLGHSQFHVQGTYRPEEAVFAPHYMKLKQERYQINTEFTASTYGGKIKSTYRATETNGLNIRSKGPFEIKVDLENNQISGFVSNFSDSEDKEFKMYFSTIFDAKINAETSEIIIGEDQKHELANFKGEDLNLFVRFDSQKEVVTTLATSFISVEQAELNLSRIKEQSFVEMKDNAEAKWLNYLNRIDVTSTNKEQVDTFYTMLYRAFLFPQKFYELNEANEPIHYNTVAKEVRPGYLYTNNGFWDTYKTVYPLYSLIATKEYEEMLESYLTSFNETGFLPKWLSPDERGLMPGTLIDAVIADAAVKGIGTKMMPEFLEAMKVAATKQSEKNNYGRRGTYDYLKYGYVPLDYHESVNHTLDYAYSDFCISQVAKTLGDTETAEFYQKQSGNFANIFDTETKFMRAKDKEGNFRASFEDTRWGLDYCEGSAWQNSYAVYHNFGKLIELHGGKEAFANKLTNLANTPPTFGVDGYGFEIHEMSEMASIDFGQIAISNQPSFHIPYLFNYVGESSTSQVILKQLMTEQFNTSWNGFPGDEDNGSMASWFVFSSLGFYPVTPGAGEYVLGIPLFDSAVIHLENGKDVTINTKSNKPHLNFVKSVSLNNEDYSKVYFNHADLVKGAEIDFELAIAPSKKEVTKEDLPFSID